jgi:hypothetical protein
VASDPRALTWRCCTITSARSTKVDPSWAEGNIRFEGGSIPVNTHRGHLSEAYIVGMTHAREAVEQMRGVAVNQVAGARVAWSPAVLPAFQSAAQSFSIKRAIMTEHVKGTYPSMLKDPNSDAATQPSWDAAPRGSLYGSAVHELPDIRAAAPTVLGSATRMPCRGLASRRDEADSVQSCDPGRTTAAI